MLSAILITIFVQPIQALSDSVRAIGEGTMVADIGASGNDQIEPSTAMASVTSSMAPMVRTSTVTSAGALVPMTQR